MEVSSILKLIIKKLELASNVKVNILQVFVPSFLTVVIGLLSRCLLPSIRIISSINLQFAAFVDFIFQK